MTDAMAEQQPPDMKPLRPHRTDAKDFLADIQQHRQASHRAADGMQAMAQARKATT